MGRQAEIQAVLQHYYIGGMLAQGPGLLLADDLDPRQRGTQAHVALHLPRRGRWLGAGAVMHQVTAKEASQLILEQALFFMQQQLPQGAGEPVPSQADQLQPVRVRLCKRFVSHCSLLHKVHLEPHRL
ncbi:hypothetical protein D9M71_699230 [compost metagenome]